MSLSKDYYINLSNGQFSGTNYKDLDKIFENLKSDDNKDKSLVLHFHGGLVTKSNALSRATGEDGQGKGLMEYYNSDNSYPIFFVWESGLGEIIKNNITEISKEPVFKKLVSRIGQFVKAKIEKELGTKGTTLELDPLPIIKREISKAEKGTMPFDQLEIHEMEEIDEVEERQFEDSLKDDASLVMEFEAIANELMEDDEIDEANASKSGRVQMSRKTLMDPTVLRDIREEAKSSEDTKGIISTYKLVKAAVVVFKNVITRLIKKTDHGVYPTIIEELLREFYLANAGKFVWDMIKKDTEDAFGEDENTYGGTAMLARIKEMAENGDKRKITLVGHSTGAIYICHMLQQADKMELPEDVKFDVIFLAGAVNFKTMADTLEKSKARIANFRNFGMTDVKESEDKLMSFVYPRSLLYLVSGILEENPDEPLVGMERYFAATQPYLHTKYPDIKTVATYMDKLPDANIWSVTDQGDGKRSASVSHVDFDNDPATMESVQYLIQNDFN